MDAYAKAAAEYEQLAIRYMRALERIAAKHYDGEVDELGGPLELDIDTAYEELRSVILTARTALERA